MVVKAIKVYEENTEIYGRLFSLEGNFSEGDISTLREVAMPVNFRAQGVYARERLGERSRL